jgi:23S rRNA (uracil1939-C5)-methyltransferase
MALAPGHTLVLTIEKPAAGGRMIARADGQVVLVAGAIPGERVAARIERTGKGVVYAQTVDVQEASPDREPPFTDPFCGGCLYAHIRYRRQLAIKADVIADAFARIGRLPLSAPPAVAASPPAGYRMRARLHARGGTIGFFREGTHEVCDARSTRQLLPATSDVLDRLGAALRSRGAASVRELDVSENIDGSGRVVHLEGVEPIDSRPLTALAATEGLTGLTASGPSGQLLIIGGNPHVTDVLRIGDRDVTLRRHVLSFFQGNRFLLGDLVARVTGGIEEGSDVVDLYAGVGLFSVAAALTRRARVQAVEGDRMAAADLDGNVHAARAAGAAIEAIHQPVEAFARRTRPAPDVLIVDPPRTGMSREALEGAVALAARDVIYVSCDVATLARDSRRLIDAGYTIDRIDAFDLFPNTPHVETAVNFRIG